AQTFFANRKAYGFNSMMIDAIATSYTDGRADASTVEGIIPLDTRGDFTTPNIAYWNKVDAIVNLAAQYGMVVFLDPAETGGWLNTAKANSSDDAVIAAIADGIKSADSRACL